MTENNELLRLEEIIENLLERYNKLDKENSRNLAVIEDKNAEIEDLQARLAGLENEKNHVQQRISGILKSIEDWESRGGDEENEEHSAGSEDDLKSSEEEWPKLFDTGS